MTHAQKTFILSDFLAVLDGSLESANNSDCRGCVEVEKLPFNFEAISDYYEQSLVMDFIRESSIRRKCDILFRRELNTCLVSSCNCFALESYKALPWSSVSYTVTRQTVELDGGSCPECVVDMPTGVLSLSDAVSTGRVDPGSASPSLVFLWTSKTNNLSVYDKLLQEKGHPINTLQVHVDFLPALELNKAWLNGKGNEHDCFIVPKHCVIHGRKHCDEWRKSNCLAEIKYVINEMSEEHRKCYKIMKYFLSFADKYHTFINWYHVKTTALNHSSQCVAPSKSCSECVLKMLAELDQSYETKTLNTFGLGLNILTKERLYEQRHMIFLEYIKLFHSVANTDSLDILVKKFNPITESAFYLD